MGFLLLRGRRGALSCFPSKEINTPGRSLPERHDCSGSNALNSTFNIACLTLVGTCADSEDCPWEIVGGMPLLTLGWLRRLAMKLGLVRSNCRGGWQGVTRWGGGSCGLGRNWVGCIFLSFSSTTVKIRVASIGWGRIRVWSFSCSDASLDWIWPLLTALHCFRQSVVRNGDSFWWIYRGWNVLRRSTWSRQVHGGAWTFLCRFRRMGICASCPRAIRWCRCIYGVKAFNQLFPVNCFEVRLRFNSHWACSRVVWCC